MIYNFVTGVNLFRCSINTNLPCIFCRRLYLPWVPQKKNSAGTLF